MPTGDIKNCHTLARNSACLFKTLYPDKAEINRRCPLVGEEFITPFQTTLKTEEGFNWFWQIFKFSSKETEASLWGRINFSQAYPEWTLMFWKKMLCVNNVKKNICFLCYFKSFFIQLWSFPAQSLLGLYLFYSDSYCFIKVMLKSWAPNLERIKGFSIGTYEKYRVSSNEDFG